MSVLFLGPLPEPVTGQSLACQVFHDELVKSRRVEVVNLSKSEFKQGISSFRRILEVLGMIIRIWRRRNACDVIYLTISESVAGNVKDLLIYLVCFRRLSRMAIHLHGGAGMREIMLGRRGRVLRNLNRFFLRRLGAVIVLGQRHVGIFADTVSRERIHIVPNFAQDHLFADMALIDRKFARVPPLRILFLSNLLPGKGHEELVDGFLALDDSGRAAVQIDFAGGFEAEDQKAAFLGRIRGHAQLRYHGTVHGATKQRLFSEAHVFCLPTYYPYEGQPISILEAYASGCAVITTDHSGIFDIFEPNVNGYQVAKASATALRAAIERAIAEPDRLHAMARANCEMARERYRTSRHTRELVGIMNAIQEQPR